MSTAKLIFSITRLCYDSRTGNLLFLNGENLVTTRNVKPEALPALLGKKEAEYLLASKAEPSSGWEYQVLGQRSISVATEPNSLTSQLVLEDGGLSDYVLHAHNEASDPLQVDIKLLGAEEGDVALAITVQANQDGMPSIAVHDSQGTWAANIDLRKDGTVAVAPGNYEASEGPSYDDILSRLAGEMERPGSDPYETLKMVANALVQAPPSALKSIMQLEPAN